MPVDSVRDGAIDILLRVFNEDAHLDTLIDRKLKRGRFSPQGARFLTHLVYGVVRHKLLCDYILSSCCDVPLDRLPEPMLMILRMGVFQQLFCETVTRPALVHTSVELARRRSHAGLAKLVNAVLRRIPNSLEEAGFPDKATAFTDYLRIRYSMPRRLVRLWIDLFGKEGAEDFCSVCNEPAPLMLRVNTAVTDVETLAKNLQRSGLLVSRPFEFLEALQVKGGPNPLQTQWYKQGHFIVQDAASILAARLVGPEPTDTIVDMCAAPGGKTTHMATLSGNLAHIFALEKYWGRIAKIRENVCRLHSQHVHIVCGDALHPPFSRDIFDKVLVDAPCSGLGTLRRHPEIKWRVQPERFALFAEIQLEMLRKAVQVCKNGGLIVYSVCTLTPEETVGVVTTFLQDGTCIPEDGPEVFSLWKTAQGQYQTNPTTGGLDGFFLIRFRKQS